VERQCARSLEARGAGGFCLINLSCDAGFWQVLRGAPDLFFRLALHAGHSSFDFLRIFSERFDRSSVSGQCFRCFFSISFGSTVASIWIFNAPLFFVRIFFERFFENL